MRRISLDSVDSTNLYCKTLLSAREDVAVTAAIQTGGRGTKGRSFLSEAGGLYLSVLNFYNGVPAASVHDVMVRAAVAVCRTAEELGADVEIKWPNDILAGEARRKLCGIRGKKLDYTIAGIGLNVKNDISRLGGIATSIHLETGNSYDVAETAERLLAHFAEEADFAYYKAHMRFLGKPVRVTEGEETYVAVAADVLEDGRLVIDRGGRMRALSSGEIAIILEGA